MEKHIRTSNSKCSNYIYLEVQVAVTSKSDPDKLETDKAVYRLIRISFKNNETIYKSGKMAIPQRHF
jgi:hypothetical protein